MIQNSNQDVQRQTLYELLGDLPEESEIRAKLIDRVEKEDYTLEKLTLELNGLEAVPAYFTTPKHVDKPAPAVLFHHSHGGNYRMGKDEYIQGNVYMAGPPYAEALAKRGFAGLCIDSWGFGERRGRSETEIFKEMLWNGQVMWGMMVYDSLRAFQYLAGRTEIDAQRIGTLGMSMGSTMAWWTAALEPDMKVCVDICCLTDFQALIEARGLDGHGIYYYVPRLLKHFTTAGINALIAPRPHLSLAGRYDRLTPEAGLDRVEAELNRVYRDRDAADAWKLLRFPTGHVETAEMRSEIMKFLSKWLAG